MSCLFSLLQCGQVTAEPNIEHFTAYTHRMLRLQFGLHTAGSMTTKWTVTPRLLEGGNNLSALLQRGLKECDYQSEDH